MEILRTIALYAEGKSMPFLIIGGHAAAAHGISRQTADIDLVVQRSCKDSWAELMAKLHYGKGQNDEKFARFRPDSLANWPIDLMFVDDQTFEKLLEQSLEVKMGAADVRVVSARHLATLKIHALKHFQQHRFAKDYSDLIGLLRSGKTGLTNEELMELCSRYASLELYERVQKDLEKL